MGGEGERAFLAVSAVGFVASASATIGMAVLDAVPICGGSMSAARPMPGLAWPHAMASFLGMWLTMMAAMMLPSLVPMLRRYRRAISARAPLDRLTALVAAGYFCVWTGAGVVVFASGALLPQMGQPAVVVLLAGLFQFTAWKRRALACCREAPSWLAADADTAWRYGLHLGGQCLVSSAGPTAILLAVGMMDLLAMVAVTVACTIERLAPGGERIARAIGLVLVGAGLVLLHG